MGPDIERCAFCPDSNVGPLAIALQIILKRSLVVEGCTGPVVVGDPQDVIIDAGEVISVYRSRTKVCGRQ